MSPRGGEGRLVRVQRHEVSVPVVGRDRVADTLPSALGPPLGVLRERVEVETGDIARILEWPEADAVEAFCGVAVEIAPVDAIARPLADQRGICHDRAQPAPLKMDAHDTLANEADRHTRGSIADVDHGGVHFSRA